jgi:hypothetical protein
MLETHQTLNLHTIPLKEDRTFPLESTVPLMDTSGRLAPHAALTLHLQDRGLYHFPEQLTVTTQIDRSTATLDPIENATLGELVERVTPYVPEKHALKRTTPNVVHSLQLVVEPEDETENDQFEFTFTESNE